MRDCEVHSHVAFVGVPPGGARRRGRYSKNVVKSDEARERRTHTVEGRRLRAWRRCAGLDLSQPIDKLRDKKRRHDAVYALNRSRDADLYRLLDDLEKTAASIILEVARLREWLIERYKTEVV